MRRIMILLLFILCLGAKFPDVEFEEPIIEELQTPTRITVDDSTGRTYILDPRSRGLHIFDKNLNFKNTLKQDNISAFYVKDNFLYVVAGDKLHIFDKNRYLTTVILPTKKVLGIIVEDNIYLLDSLAGTVIILDSKYRYITKFGGFGKVPGTFVNPLALKYERHQKQFYVVDAGDNSIKIFDINGTIIRVINSLSGHKFGQISSVVFEYDRDILSRIYVLDAIHANIQVFDSGFNHLYNTNLLITNTIFNFGPKYNQLLNPTDFEYNHINHKLIITNGLSNAVVLNIKDNTLAYSSRAIIIPSQADVEKPVSEKTPDLFVDYVYEEIIDPKILIINHPLLGKYFYFINTFTDIIFEDELLTMIGQRKQFTLPIDKCWAVSPEL